MTGVFTVTFTPNLAGTSFQILMRFNGLEVDSTAEYRSNTLTVLPNPTPSASTSNYTILPLSDQFSIVHSGPDPVTYYTYQTGDYFNVILDSRDEFENLRYSQTADKYYVTLTKDCTVPLSQGLSCSATVISGLHMTAMGNGSYVDNSLQF